MRIIDTYTRERFSRIDASLCSCWRITRKDSQEFGFTDHDRDIEFGGTHFRSMTGADGTVLENSVDLAPDNADMLGFFSPTFFDENDIALGLFDDAEIELWRVDWEDPTARLLVKVGSIGNVEHDGHRYVAEFRSLKHYLNQRVGRVYGRMCDADLGDKRCGVDLTSSAYTLDATISAGNGRTYTIAAESFYENGFFDGGVMRVLSGNLQGTSKSVQRQGVDGDDLVIELWETFGTDVAPGTSVQLIAGCNKSLETCSVKFSNVINFRGFPYIPGTDILTLTPSAADTGGSSE